MPSYGTVAVVGQVWTADAPSPWMTPRRRQKTTERNDSGVCDEFAPFLIHYTQFSLPWPKKSKDDFITLAASVAESVKQRV